MQAQYVALQMVPGLLAHFPDQVHEVHEVRGEVPKAFVIARDGLSIEDKELRAFCRQHLASYKVPKHFEIVSDLPRTPTGKVLKRMLSAKA